MTERTKFTDFNYKLQAFGLKVLEKFFLLMGLKFSSFLFGILFTLFGPLTPPSFLAMRNIKKALPNLTFFQRFKIILGMWNNLGRNMAEFVEFNSNDYGDLSNFVSLDNKTISNLNKIKEDGVGTIIFTAHFGNWELFASIFAKYNIPFSAIYRKMNNNYADSMVTKYRERSGMEMIPKGQKGVIKLVRDLKNGRKILMLVDQRLSNGISVPFFNIPSKTTDSVAVFSLKHNYKVYSAVVFRKSFSCAFDVKIEEFEVVNTGNLEKDIKDTTEKINKKMEGWIKAKPEQWFWVHDRWKV